MRAERKKERKIERKKGCIGTELSLWALLARSCFYKILAVLALMTAAEGFLLYKALYKQGILPGFEQIIDESMMSPIFMAALGIIFFIFVCMEGMLERESSCTLMRLKVTEWHFFWTKTAANLLFLLMPFAVQIGMALFAAQLYAQAAGPERLMPQFLFLAFYSNSFLHCLLPMAHGAKWVRNVLILAAFSMEGGSGRWGKQDRSQYYVQPVVLFVVMAQWFVSDMDDYRDIICVIVCCVYIAAAIWSVYRKTERKIWF